MSREPLFEPGGRIYESKPTRLRMTEAQRLRAALNAEKAKVPDLSEVIVDTEKSVLHAEGQTYLLPLDFVEAVKRGDVKRVGDDTPPQYIDGVIEEKLLNWSVVDEPRYWLHVPDGDATVTYPVYGYMADYGYGYVNPPMCPKRYIEAAHEMYVEAMYDQPGWDTAEWLCRCAQCGRELPPSYYFINTNGRPKGICKACTSTNNIVDALWGRAAQYGIKYLYDEELTLLKNMRHWYEALWLRNLCPRGSYAEHILGKDNIEARINATIKHRRGSAPRRPQHVSTPNIQRINELIAETSPEE